MKQYLKKILIAIVFASMLILSACTGATNTNKNLNLENADPVKLELATCLADSGAKFYGAYWCPHCNDQKDLFGDAQLALPYVECEDNKQLCAEAGITGYPTWIFADGSAISGTQTFDVLAKASGCTWEGA